MLNVHWRFFKANTRETSGFCCKSNLKKQKGGIKMHRWTYISKFYIFSCTDIYLGSSGGFVRVMDRWWTSPQLQLKVKYRTEVQHLPLVPTEDTQLPVHLWDVLAKNVMPVLTVSIWCPVTLVIPWQFQWNQKLELLSSEWNVFPIMGMDFHELIHRLSFWHQ